VSRDISPLSRIAHPSFNIWISVIAFHPISTVMGFLNALDEENSWHFVTFDHNDAAQGQLLFNPCEPLNKEYISIVVGRCHRFARNSDPT
jgi:hypothetical protein